MKERPIIFDDASVRAILAGRKTQTRRVVKPQPIGRGEAEAHAFGGELMLSPGGGLLRLRESRGRNARACGIMTEHKYTRYGVPGDRLWVRETWRRDRYANNWSQVCVQYRAGGEQYFADPTDPVAVPESSWRSPLHMPRWASRLTLEVVDVRVQRLQDISERDAAAEGVWTTAKPDIGTSSLATALFEARWTKINGKTYPWASNPWVWAVTFKLVDAETRGDA